MPAAALKPVLALHPAGRDDIGDLTTRRPLPGPKIDLLDPFLFLNHHGPQTYPPGNAGLPFGPHPHRGFETVTFILEGELAHSDTGGHESIIGPGGVQWMTAGSGLVHAELSPASFKKAGGPLEILQLWVNLPARLKMTQPRYTGLQRDAIPALPTEDGHGVVNLVSGRWNGHAGPIPSLTGVMMSVVTLQPGGRFRADGLDGRNVFLYVVRGGVLVDGTAAKAFHLVELGAGDAVEVFAGGPEAKDGGAVLLFGHADPIGEPVVAYGPFVMNTPEEIRQAVRDYQAGLFDRPPE